MNLHESPWETGSIQFGLQHKVDNMSTGDMVNVTLNNALKKETYKEVAN